MKTNEPATFLIPRRWILAGVVPGLIGGGATLFTLMRVYQDVSPSRQWIVEGTAGIGALVIIFIPLWYFVVSRRSYRLERELSKVRASGKSGDGITGVGEFSRLGALIQEYGNELSRLSTVKSGRIKAQKTLIETIMRNIGDHHIIVLSGAGSVLYTSAGWAETGENEQGRKTPVLDPPAAALSSALLSGKGRGTVLVNGIEMSYAGIFGRTVGTSSGSGDGASVFKRTLVYIVISDRELSIPQASATIVTDEGEKKRGIVARIRSLMRGT